MTNAPTPAPAALGLGMTPAAIEFMTLVGTRSFDFFDDGIVAGSGIWGRHMAEQAASMMGKSPRSMGGIMARMAGLGLWTCDDQGVESSGNARDTTWWALTADGARVANMLAEAQAPAVEAVTEAPAVVVPGKLRAHEGCTHATTKAARAACRRAAAKLDREGAAPLARVIAREAELDDAFSDDDEDAALAELVIDTATDDDDRDAMLELLADEDGNAYADAMLAELEAPCTCDAVDGSHEPTRACY